MKIVMRNLWKMMNKLIIFILMMVERMLKSVKFYMAINCISIITQTIKYHKE